MKKTGEKRNVMKQMILILCAAIVAISTVLGSGAMDVQAATLSGYGLTKQEKTVFTRILKKEAKKKKSYRKNADKTVTNWSVENGPHFKDGYTGFTEYTVQNLNGKNMLCLYGDGIKESTYGTFAYTVMRMYYLVNGKIRTNTEYGEEYHIEICGYSPKAKGLVLHKDNDGQQVFFLMNYHKGKIKTNKTILSFYDADNPVKYCNGQKISKSKYDKIYNTYYANGKYKEIKWKKIKAFK